MIRADRRGEVTLRGAIIVVVLGAVTAAALALYSRLGPASILDGAEAGLKSGDWKTRRQTVEGVAAYMKQGGLDESPKEADRAKSLLASALADENAEVKHAAIAACGNLRLKRAVAPLCEILSGKVPAELRVAAARALGSIGDSRAADPLSDVMETSKEPENLRAAAIDALGTCGGMEMIAPLFRQRMSGNDNISAHAGLALTKIRSRNTVLRAYGLGTAVGDLNTKLGRMQKAIDENQQALDTLLDEIDGTDPTRAGPLSGLYAKLDSKEADVRLAAIYDIELVGSKKSVAQLARMLADEDEAVRTAARGALVKIVGEDLGDDKKPWLEWHHENVKR